ncbi:protein tyrosine phosphatase [Sphingobacterium oryzagri]|uniref:protein-tyrosine-phosphatase n=1 Tax=Sphingobacterium oryzagri TaxID=3025669 RepID=A0ABY7WKM9_9SPHI|nr:CpsB/CapC family capsule biosynthesis tyrosine phosphatase [Sphingobacterium sp. KACC 22765]WDF68953.1 protein tyrosine phosphatase [Sphingobacterium sp. KACC 22765]
MSFWERFFSRKVEQNIHLLDWLTWDIHNHILPGIDDGSANIDQSLKLINGLKNLGIKGCVCTPHIMAGVHPNTPKTISGAYEQLKQELVRKNIDFQLEYAAEYMIDEDLAGQIAKGDLCLLPNGHMLIEMSYLSESKALFHTIKSIKDKGYQPVLAHPERYNYFHHNFQIFKDIKNAGCLLQLNLLSVSRYYGQHVKNQALILIKSGMYDFVGTDMHHERHLAAIKEVLQKYDVEELLRPCNIRNAQLFCTKPAVVPLHIAV